MKVWIAQVLTRSDTMRYNKVVGVFSSRSKAVDCAIEVARDIAGGMYGVRLHKGDFNPSYTNKGVELGYKCERFSVLIDAYEEEVR